MPGKINVVADRLSRLAQPRADTSLPPQLRDAKRRQAPKRNNAFFKAAVAPECERQVTAQSVEQGSDKLGQQPQKLMVFWLACLAGEVVAA